MTAQEHIKVRVNDELVLAAGTREPFGDVNCRELLIRSPEITLFRQLLAYLSQKPDPI